MKLLNAATQQMMALPPFTINNKDIQGQGSVLSTFFRGTKWIRFIRCTKCIRCFMCIKCTGLVGCSYIFGPFWAPGTSWIAHKVWLVSKTHQHSVCGWAACFSPIRDLYSTPRDPKTARFGPKQPLGGPQTAPRDWIWLLQLAFGQVTLVGVTVTKPFGGP